MIKNYILRVTTLLLLLPSCVALRPLLMVPSGYEKDEGCLYHYYGKVTQCKGYKILPVDPVKAVKEEEVSIEDYQQYKGRIIYEK